MKTIVCINGSETDLPQARNAIFASSRIRGNTVTVTRCGN